MKRVHRYGYDEFYPLAIPYHTTCCDLLEKHISSVAGVKHAGVDYEVLYQTMKEFLYEGDESAVSLTQIDYGLITDYQDQYWWCRRGTESFVINPVAIPELEAYYTQLPPLSGSEGKQQWPRRIKTDSKDPFAKLAPELILTILSSLPIASLGALRTASPTVHQLELSNGFWKLKAHQDMPWLYDMPEPTKNATEVDRESPNWAQVYRDLLWRSKEGNPHKFYGLVNRRRIWEISTQLVNPYVENKSAKDDNQKKQKNQTILEGAISSPSWRLIWPNPTNSKTSTIALVSDFATVGGDQGPTLSFFWSKLGTLSGIGVGHGNASRETQRMETIGMEGHFAVQYKVQIPPGDWLKGFVLTSRYEDSPPEAGQERGEYMTKVVGLKVLFYHGNAVQFGESRGNHRLIPVRRDLLVVGLMAKWTSDGKISSLSLLQASPPVSASGHSSIAEQLARAETDELSTCSEAVAKLWKDHLPPPESSVSQPRGYLDPPADLDPMQPLIFGHDEEELSAITEISGDVQSGGFQVRYSDRPPRSIGTRLLAMKSLQVDGQGGERLVAIRVRPGSLTFEVQFVTNRNRQLVLGSEVHASNMDNQNLLLVAGEGRILCGIYCFFSMRLLSCFGLITRQSHDAAPSGVPEAAPTGPLDVEGYPWEPQSPPAGWKEAGPVYGQRVVHYQLTVSWPGVGTVVSWLDCTRSVDKVTLTRSHPTLFFNPFSFIGMILHYSDGSIGSVGPTRLTDPTDTDGHKGAPWCTCKSGYRVEPRDEVMKKRHYYFEEWEVGGAFLESLHLWGKMDEEISDRGDASANIGNGPPSLGPIRGRVDGGIEGLQLVSGKGEGPRWGKCDGRPTDTISFSQGGTGAVGLKLYSDHNCSLVTPEDVVVTCIQALVDS